MGQLLTAVADRRSIATMLTPKIDPVTTGTAHRNPDLLITEQVTARQAAYLGQIPGVDVPLQEVSTGFGEVIFVDPRNGATL